MVFQNEYGYIEVLEMGASLKQWICDGKRIVSEYKSQDDYFYNKDYLNSAVGPTSGRYVKDGEIILHGGEDGYSYKKFNLIETEEGIDATYHDDKLKADIKYRYILKKNALRIEITADLEGYELRHLNLTSHLYLKVSKNTVNTAKLTIPSRTIIRKNGDIPEAIEKVPDCLDFSFEREIKDTVIDHCYIFDETGNLKIRDEWSLLLNSSYKSCVVYSYDFPNKDENKRSALAVEPQYIPNAFRIADADVKLFNKDRKYVEFIEWSIETSK